MYLSSWETTARYMFKKTRFRLSIPYLHPPSPISLSIRYDLQSKTIEIEGRLEKDVPHHPLDIEVPQQISYDNEKAETNTEHRLS